MSEFLKYSAAENCDGSSLQASPKLAMLELMNWPGTKNGSGVAERLISQIPPHEIYIAPFAGHCAVASKMRPARRRIFVDLDERALNYWRARQPAECYLTNCIDWLSHWFELDRFDSSPARRPEVFVHIDPPYYPGTCGAGIYRHELSREEHARLLSVALRIPAAVMIAGYRCELYDAKLHEWRRMDYTVQTRGGPKRESVWMNYAVPSELQDPRFIGRDKRDRERIRKRQRNMVNLVKRLPPLERQALLDMLSETTASVVPNG